MSSNKKMLNDAVNAFMSISPANVLPTFATLQKVSELAAELTGATSSASDDDTRRKLTELEIAAKTAEIQVRAARVSLIEERGFDADFEPSQETDEDTEKAA